MKTKTVSVRMTTDMHDELKQLSKQSGMNVSQIITRLIEKGNVVMVKEGGAIAKLLFDITMMLRENPRCDLEEKLDELAVLLNDIFDTYYEEDSHGDFENGKL